MISEDEPTTLICISSDRVQESSLLLLLHLYVCVLFFFSTNRDIGCVLGVLIDLDRKKLSFTVNGDEPTSAMTFENLDFGSGVTPAISGSGTICARFNLGSRKFKYDIPEGFLPIESKLVAVNSWVDRMGKNYGTISTMFRRQDLPEATISKALEKEGVPQGSFDCPDISDGVVFFWPFFHQSQECVVPPLLLLLLSKVLFLTATGASTFFITPSDECSPEIALGFFVDKTDGVPMAANIEANLTDGSSDTRYSTRRARNVHVLFSLEEQQVVCLFFLCICCSCFLILLVWH